MSKKLHLFLKIWKNSINSEKSGIYTVKASYDEAIQKSGGTQIALGRQREKVVKELQRQNEQLLLHQKLAKQLESVNRIEKNRYQNYQRLIKIILMPVANGVNFLLKIQVINYS